MKTGKNILNDIAFKTQAHTRNYDMVGDGDNIMTEYAGTISMLRIAEQKPPVIIGEYTFSVLDMSTAFLLGIDVHQLIKAYAVEDIYKELLYALNNDFLYYRELTEETGKVVLLHSYMLHPDYRKQGVTEEFIEMLHREFYSPKNAIIALVKPFQENLVDADYYLNKRTVEVRDTLHGESKYIPSLDYYSLADLMTETDTELIEYKLFAIANRCGFERLGDSHLFMYTPDKIKKRMLDKKKLNSTTL